MSSRIVLKLFLLTTVLCTLILAAVYVGQTFFFKEYYMNRKINDIKSSMLDYKREYVNSGDSTQTVEKLEQDLDQNHNTWATVLDAYGNLILADDFSVELFNGEDKKTYTIPLYNNVTFEEAAAATFPLKINTPIIVDGIRKEATLVPNRIIMTEAINKMASDRNLELIEGQTVWTNEALDLKVQEEVLKYKMDQANRKDDEDTVSAFPLTTLEGTITKVNLQSSSGMSKPIYTNHLFLEQINEFQKNLLFSTEQPVINSFQTVDYELNNVTYKLFILPTLDSGGAVTYFFAMASLQPVDEAVQVIKDYFVYIVALVMILILLASFYYSVTIARPLLRINQATKKLAEMDFTATISVTTKDEIGDLSRNINSLSIALHSHLTQLQQELAKEKQLENTRKEFISGVSHELKTPLSVMKSCIAIMQDGVASHKREHYFEALDKEVSKMDLLIVDMLELAKYESGTYHMKKEIFDIDKVTEAVCDSLALEIANKQLYIRLNLSEAKVLANPNRIEQVITNFMTNAIRYTPSGQEIIVSTSVQSNEVIVCIENKGAHIPDTLLDKVWDRFYRGDSSRERAHGGTGLGLAISKKILELHCAEYGVANTEDGVAFYFILDIVA